MNRYWTDSFGNAHSNNHAVGWKAAQTVDESRESIARLVGADPDEIVFTSGATESNNLALLGLAHLESAQPNAILVSAIEHKCVLESSRFLQEHQDFRVNTIPVDRYGGIDLGALEKMVDSTVAVTSIMAVNNEIGTIQPIDEISQLLRSKGVIFHCDAAQAPCAMDITKLAEQADLISLSGHKMYGPQGIGALYIRRDLMDSVRPLIHGGGQQNGIRSGTVPVPLCVGMASAADLLPNRDERNRVSRLRDEFIAMLRKSDTCIELNGPPMECRHPGNANLCFRGFDAEDILATVQPRLAASTGSACTTGIPEPSHVLSAIGLSREACVSSIRFSFGRFTNEQDIQSAAEIIIQTLKDLS